MSDTISGVLIPEATYRELMAERARLRDLNAELVAALKCSADIIDKMGDMPDGLINPIPWRELKCDDALKQARAAIAKAERETRAAAMDALIKTDGELL